MSSTSKAVKINQLSFGFSKKDLIFNNLTLTIPRGGFSLLTGPTGCGKSTLLKLLSTLYPEFTGKIYHGTIDNLPNTWSMIFQNPDKQFTMATPRQEFIFTLENLNLDPENANKRIKQAVISTHIQDLLDQNFNTLSGGEKQRVAFGLALAMQPDLLLLDEPFASCDSKTRSFLLKQLKILKKTDTTIILADHNLSGYQELVDEVYQFKEEKIVRLSPSQKKLLFSKPKHSPLSFKLPTTTDPSSFYLKDFELNLAKKALIKQTSLTIPKGKAILLTGENGAGKSSFFKALTKILPYEGHLLYQGHEVKKSPIRSYLANVSQVFQDPNDQFLMITVKEELDFSLQHNHNPLINEQTLSSLLGQLGLLDHLDQVVYSLSGGQKKKLQVLEMLMANPSVLLLDEPFAGLDQQSGRLIINLLKKYYLINKKTLILISHQFDFLDQLCDYHLHLKNHQLTFEDKL